MQKGQSAISTVTSRLGALRGRESACSKPLCLGLQFFRPLPEHSTGGCLTTALWWLIKFQFKGQDIFSSGLLATVDHAPAHFCSVASELNQRLRMSN